VRVGVDEGGVGGVCVRVGVLEAVWEGVCVRVVWTRRFGRAWSVRVGVLEAVWGA